MSTMTQVLRKAVAALVAIILPVVAHDVLLS